MLFELTATELGRKLRAREVSAPEVAKAFLDQIASRDEALGAFLATDPERTLAEAAKAQALLDAGEGGALTGVPYAAKDNLSTQGLETTCASKILKGYVPPYDATVVERLGAQGCPLLGKTNLDEFAMGTSTERSAFQLTRNPHDLERSPGGSSGGSAACVAAGLSPLSLGSDTGGSIRQPAALCGIVGFKPTYGRCSRYGLVAFASSLDQIGPFGRTVEDAALLASVITGPDRHDSTCLDHPAISLGDLKSGTLKGARFALPKQFLSDAVHPGVKAAFEAAADAIRKEGAVITEVDVPSIEVGVTTYYIIAPAEASSNLARFDGVRYGPRAESSGHIGVVERSRAEGFGHEVKQRIMIGTYALSAGYYDAYYVRAQQVRAKMAFEFARVFDDYDAIIGPTSPIPAFKFGELMGDPMALKLLDFLTIPANMTGSPAISLNCGHANGLPVGIHLMAKPMLDEKLLQLAHTVETALGLPNTPVG